MELILLIGIQATGKSTFYKRTLSDTHIRLNMDMLKTRNREAILLEACLRAKQPCVIDNTNPTKLERARYIESAQKQNFSVRGIFFASGMEEALRRNQKRAQNQRVPDVGIRGTRNKLEMPELGEGFDTLQYASISDNGEFSIAEWDSGI